MKYSEFKEGDTVLIVMPKDSGFERPQKAKVVEKGEDGVVLFQKPDGRRWWANSRRIKSVVITKQEGMREAIIEIVASALSDDDVRNRADEILQLIEE